MATSCTEVDEGDKGESMFLRPPLDGIVRYTWTNVLMMCCCCGSCVRRTPA